jgi:hypothetical protein
MNRATRRSIILVAGLAACNGDPTGDLRNGVDHLIATPGAIFLTRGAVTSVTVEAVDEQGNRQGTRFTLGAVSPSIMVVEDSTFNLIYDKNGNLVFPEKPTRLRYAVSPLAVSGEASFVVRAGGKEITIAVRLVPDSVAASYSNPVPAAGDTVTLTTGAPFQFLANATLDAGGNPAILLGQTATTIRFVPIPGGAPGPATVNGVALDYATSLSLSLPTTSAFTTPAGLSGVDALATAPAITIPAAGAATMFVDAGVMQPVSECDGDNGSPCRAYRLELATARTFRIDARWQGTSDLGLYFYDAAGNGLPGPCDSNGNGVTGQPESCTKTLGPGTFYVTVVDFGLFYDPVEAEPVWIRLDIAGQ